MLQNQPLMCADELKIFREVAPRSLAQSYSYARKTASLRTSGSGVRISPGAPIIQILARLRLIATRGSGASSEHTTLADGGISFPGPSGVRTLYSERRYAQLHSMELLDITPLA